MLNFVFSDIHGRADLFEKILDFLNSQTEEWHCYFLGDACDRCRNGYKIIKILLNDNKFTYLKGNHEDMFVRAARALRKHWEEDKFFAEDIKKNSYESIMNYCYDWDVSAHIQNGGLSTLLDWVEDQSGGPAIINELDKLPFVYNYQNKDGENIELSHSGHLINVDPNDDDAYFWSRDHFNEYWPFGRMIHGHTPVRSLMKWTPIDSRGHTARPAFYQKESKICLDTACFKSGTIVLLNLDTFEQHVFTDLFDKF